MKDERWRWLGYFDDRISWTCWIVPHRAEESPLDEIHVRASSESMQRMIIAGENCDPGSDPEDKFCTAWCVCVCLSCKGRGRGYKKTVIRDKTQ